MTVAPLWLIQNVRLADRDGLWQIAINKGRFGEITPMGEVCDESHEVLSAHGGLAIPPLIEPYIYLGTIQMVGEPHQNRPGTLFEGIERWAERKALLSHEDVKAWAWKTLRWQITNGVQFVRTHVDVSDPTLMALKAMLEVKREVASWVGLQIIASPQEGILSYLGSEVLLGEALKLGADVVGAIPYFEFIRKYGVKPLHIVFRLTQKHDHPLDIHCDEIDDEQSRFVETAVALASKAGIGVWVAANHTTVMYSYNGAHTSRLSHLPKLSGINFVANPLVNIRLQGRFDSYPKRRGITRVKELVVAGINVCFGHDDAFDPWYPLGIGNMLQVLHMGLRVCQLMGYQQINDGLKFITDGSARAFDLEDYGTVSGNPANPIILPAESGFEAVRRQVPVRWSIRQGRVIATTQLAQTWIQIDRGGEELSLMRNSPLVDAKGSKAQ